MPPLLLWLLLALLGAAILVSSHFLVRSADVIANRTGLGRSFVGVLLLATATSLPELVTGVSAIALVDEPDLAAGDAFGSNLVNLLIIGIIDIRWPNEPILAAVGRSGRGAMVVGVFGIAVIACAMLGMAAHSGMDASQGLAVSPITVAMFLVFLVGMFVIYRQEPGAPVGAGGQSSDAMALPNAIARYLIAMAAIVISAVALAQTGEALAESMGWEASFVGTQFLAICTSLPELAASVAAVRIGAPDLAIANLLGSNLFNMGFVLAADDLAFLDGPIWAEIAGVHLLTAGSAIVMTLVALGGLSRPRRGRPASWFTWDALALVALYAAASALVPAFA